MTYRIKLLGTVAVEVDGRFSRLMNSARGMGSIGLPYL